jgi:ABC-type antimicrobial peptide transport system permease subunit
LLMVIPTSACTMLNTVSVIGRSTPVFTIGAVELVKSTRVEEWTCTLLGRFRKGTRVVPVHCYGHLNIYIHFTNIQHDTNNVETSTIMVKYLMQQTKNVEKTYHL